MMTDADPDQDLEFSDVIEPQVEDVDDVEDGQ
jgi:hypothetical protein